MNDVTDSRNTVRGQSTSAIVSGWTLHSGIDDLTERLEAAAEWTKANGPLQPDEEATIELMIEAQVARGGFDGTGDYD